MEAYKAWVRRNHQWLASIESVANTMTWLLPERLSSSELLPEAVSTMVGLVTVLNQHIVETTPDSRTPRKGFPWHVFVSVVKEMEVLVEVTAEHYRGIDGKWTPLASVEALKALLRLIILRNSGCKMLIDGGETVNLDELSPLATGGRSSDSSSRRQGFMEPYTAKGRAMEAMHSFGSTVGGRPSWSQNRPSSAATAEEKKKFSVLTVAEIALILRPLTYVLLIRRYGLKSWRPWLLSLAMDVTGLSLVYLSSKQTESTEKQELKRRQLQLAFYLLKSPFFDKYTRPKLQKLERFVEPLPLFGSLSGKALELLNGVQSIYSYTSGS